MISIIKIGGVNGDSTTWFSGLSTDENPTGNIPNGSKFEEIDTGKIYYYDSAGGHWYEVNGNE